VLDARAFTLTRGNEELALQPKVFDVLRYLLEHRDRVVTKDELLDALWAEEHVNEGAVPWSISHARRALGQGRGQKHPIETVHGRGYRFAAGVELLPTTIGPDAVAQPAPAPAPAKTTVAGAHSLPFVGRAEVMQRLEANLARAIGGDGGMCLLIGEAGIGKTRCSEELALRAQRRGVSVYSGRSVEGVGAPVFWPWLQVLREAARDRPTLNEAASGLLSRLTELSGASGAGAAGDDERHDTDAGRFWVLDGVSRFLLDAARETPIVVLLDDLHFADAGTIELAGFLAPELRRSALLLVATLRDEVPEGAARGMGRLLRSAERIELEGLSREDVTRYIAEVTHAKEPAAELCSAVHRASAGNPLFVQETLRALLAEHGARGLPGLAPEAVKPSQIARDVLRSRLRPLDAPTLSALGTASVLGESFEVPVLQRLASLSLDQLLAALERASQAGLLVAEGLHRYRFAHALLRSLLYEDLPSSERVAMHRRAAELLAELYRAQPRHSEVAHHYYRSLPAGDYDRVAEACTHAAEAAARVQAYNDAAGFYEWALEAQALDPQVTPRTRAELLFACGSAQRWAGRDEAARRTLSRVIELARQHDYADLLLNCARVLRPTHVMAAVPDPLVRTALEEVLKIAPEGPSPLRIGALSHLACLPPYANDMQRSRELSGQALALARERGVESSLFQALRARLYSLSGPDDIDAQLEVAAEILESGARTGMYGEAHAARFGAFAYRGDMVAAREALQACGRISNELRMPEMIWFHDRIAAQWRFLDGDFAGAEAASAELKARSERMGLSYGAAFIGVQQQLHARAISGPGTGAERGNLAAVFAAGTLLHPTMRATLVRLAAEIDDRDGARRMLDTMAARDFDDIAKDIGYLNALHHLALAAAILGDRPRAERLYELLAPYPNHNTPNNMMFYEGSASYALALLAEALDDGRAGQHFEDAIAMNERIGMRPQVARVCYSYALWLKKQPARAQQAQAGELAARARSLAEALGMNWLVERASTV
jgi:DNA-binding winged helix-turn-helix (wHTH) protein